MPPLLLGEQISAESAEAHLYIRVHTSIQMVKLVVTRPKPLGFPVGALPHTLIGANKNKAQCLTSIVADTKYEGLRKSYLLNCCNL